MLNGFLGSAQHRPLGKALSEPVTVATVPINIVSRQTSEPVAPTSHNVRSPIVEENEDGDNGNNGELVSDTEKISEGETVEDIQLKGRDDHVMIVITAAQEDTEEDDQKDTEYKPLLRRQDSVDNDHELTVKQDTNDDNETV